MNRSSIVHAAKQAIPSRFELITTAAKLARLIHVPTQERLAETINRALLKISGMERQKGLRRKQRRSRRDRGTA